MNGFESECPAFDSNWSRKLEITNLWNFSFVKITWESIQISWFSHRSGRITTYFSILSREIGELKHLLPLKNRIWGFCSMQTRPWCRRLPNQETNNQKSKNGNFAQEFWIFENSPRICPKSPGPIFQWFLWTSRGPVTWNQQKNCSSFEDTVWKRWCKNFIDEFQDHSSHPTICTT